MAAWDADAEWVAEGYPCPSSECDRYQRLGYTMAGDLHTHFYEQWMMIERQQPVRNGTNYDTEVKPSRACRR